LAIPKRPVDRGSTDDTMAHFIPTRFDPVVARLIGLPLADDLRPVRCSVPLVQSTVIESKSGMAIPLVNWSGGPGKGLGGELTSGFEKVSRASGQRVDWTRTGDRWKVTLDLDVADALILR